jgi:serine/threonine protein kinase
MSTYTSEPGTRLAGRYRLVDQTSAGTGWTYWKATDETLARPVTVLTFAPGFPRIGETVTAARAASRLNESRFAQVFDVDDSGEIAYVVLEWVRGETLADMVAEGPLEPRRAVTVLAEATHALAAAHRVGQAHLHLNPSCLHWTPGGGVKIWGLGIDAALAGPDLASTDLAGTAPAGPDLASPTLAGTDLAGTDLAGTAPAEAEQSDIVDTRGLAWLLYAALTGYWPGPGSTTLPPAPTESDGTPCTPRQVMAGVPAAIDSVTCRAMFQQPNRQGPPLTTPTAFADALSEVTPRPVPPALPRKPTSAFAATDTYRLTDDGTNATRGPTGGMPPSAGYRRRHPASERSAVARAMVSAVIVLVLAAVAVTAWAISRSLHHSASAGPSSNQQRSSSSGPAAAASVVLKPTGISVYNLQGTTDDPGEAQYALGGSSGKFWHTEYYLQYPQFGHLKSGVGLLLDMGSQVRLSQVNVQFGTSCCTHATIELGNSATGPLSSFTPVASSTTAAGNTTFPVSSNATGQYVLIWITYLPPLPGQADAYQAQIYDVVVHGAAT